METDTIIFQCNDGDSIKIPLKYTDGISMVREMEPDVFPFEIPLLMYSSGPVSFLVDFAMELSTHGTFTIRQLDTHMDDRPRGGIIEDMTNEAVYSLSAKSLKEIGFPEWAYSCLSKLSTYEKCQVLELANFLRFNEMEAILIAAIGNDIYNLSDKVFTDTFQLKNTPTPETDKEILVIESWAFTSPSLPPGASLSRPSTIPLTDRTKEEYGENIPLMGADGSDDLSKGLLLLPVNLFRRVIECI